MFSHLLTKKKMKWRTIAFFLIILMLIPCHVIADDKDKGGLDWLFSYGKDKDGKGDDDSTEEDLDFEIINQTLLAVNETGYAISEMSSVLGNAYYPASNANDGDLDTVWSNFLNLLPGASLKVDFGETILVSMVRIINYVDTNAGMASFDLQYYSDLSSSWVDIGTYDTSLEDGEAITVEVDDIETQMLRITNFTKGTLKNCVAIREFQVNVPTISASGYDNDSLPEYVNDTDKTTYWSLCDPASSDYLEVDLGKVVLLTGVSLINGVDSNIGLKSFDVQYYDGGVWQTIGTYETSLKDGEVIELSTPRVKTRYVRLTNFTTGDSKECIAISEFLVNSPVITSNKTVDDDYLPFYAGDEDEVSYWTDCGDFDSTDYLKIDLGNYFNVSRMELVNYYPDSGTTGMLGFDLQYYDGSQWVTIDSYVGANKHQTEFNIRFDDVINARFFKITNFSAGANRECVGINEVSFFTPERNYYRLDYVGPPVIEKIELGEDESSQDNTEDRDIVITGSLFIEGNSQNTVYFKNDENEFEITGTTATSTEICGTIPADTPAGAYDVYVSNANGDSNTLTWEITDDLSPVIEKIELSEDESSSDNTEDRDIIITGSLFIEGSKQNTVHFQNSEDEFVISLTMATSTTINCTIPADTPVGVYDVYVSNANGDSNILTYSVTDDLSPVIEKIELGADETAPDNTEDRDIVIIGSLFVEGDSQNTVYFKNTENEFEITATSATSTEIYCTIPAETTVGVYDVYVSNANGDSNILTWEITEEDISNPEGNLGLNSSEFGVCFVSVSAQSASAGFGLGLIFLLISAIILVNLFHEKYHTITGK